MNKNMSRKIKILQFPIAASKGGITQYALQNWKFIDKSRFQFDFATMSKSLNFAKELEQSGSKIHYISCYAEEDKEKFIGEFRKILSEGSYDVVHLHTKQWKSFYVEEVAKEVGVKKIIVHAHSSGIDTLDEKLRKAEIQLHNSVLKNLKEETGTDYWACSKRAAEFLFGNKIEKTRIKIMKNAIDLSRFKFDIQTRMEYRKALGVEEKFVIGNVGRLAYPKNQDFLLKVFENLSAVCDSCVLILTGTGENEKTYKKYVKEKGLEDKVLFLGQRDDVPGLLQAMDIFALPSKFEGLPIGAVEAQAAGLKCICSDGITKEIKITDNIKFVPLDIELWKNEFLEQMGNYERKDMTQIMAAAGYDILSAVKEIENEYSRVD